MCSSNKRCLTMVMGINSFSSYGSMGASNVPQYFHQKYGNGPADFSTRGYEAPCPIAYTPVHPNLNPHDNAFKRFIRKCFS